MLRDLKDLKDLRRVVDFQLVSFSSCCENDDFSTYSLHVGVETGSEFNGLLIYFSLQLNATQIKHGKVVHKAGKVAKPDR